MTKEELCNLVDQVYATYNKDLPLDGDEIKALYTAWYEVLHDLGYTETKAAFLDMTIWNDFLPRPGNLRRLTIEARPETPKYDDPIIAWGKWISLLKDLNAGMAPSVAVSDALRITLEKIGDAAHGMHTNGDREAFCRAYEKTVQELSAQLYSIPPIEMTKQKEGN